MQAELSVKIAAGLLFSVLAGLLLALASNLNLLPEAPDKFTYDWRTYFLAERAPASRDDVALVLIDEQTLTGYDYLSPIDRGMLARLINRLDAAGAKAIGLDAIFDRRTEPKKDDELVEAIRAARASIIMGAIDRRSGDDPEGLAFQEAFIAKTGRTAGHIYFGADKSNLSLSDQAVRYILPPSDEPPHRRAFASLLAEADGPKPHPDSPYIFWRRPPPGAGSELFPTFFVPAHRNDDGSPKGQIIPDSWLGALKGKTVIVGGAFRDRDLHLTPLTVATKRPIHGAEIHGQILAQIIDGRAIHELAFWQEFLAAALVTGLGFLAAERFTLTSGGLISTAIAFVFIVAFGALLFAQTRYILPSAALFIAWAAGLFAGNRADQAIAEYWYPLRGKQIAGKGSSHA